MPKRVDGVVGYAQDFHPQTDLTNPNYQGAIALPDNLDPGNQRWTWDGWVKRVGYTTDMSVFQKGTEWVAGRQRFQLLILGSQGGQFLAQSS